MPGHVKVISPYHAVTTWGKRTYHHHGAGAVKRANAQLRLLGAIKHGWKPTRRR
jgi:hypothetical protein